MRAEERHHLKQNEFAQAAARVAGVVEEKRSQIVLIAGIVVAVLVLGGGYLYWSSRTNAKASDMLGQALAITEAPVVPAATVGTGAQTAGTYPTETAKHEAALAAFRAASSAYPGTFAGRAAAYHAGSELLALGRASEAEQAFAGVVSSGDALLSLMAKLGVAQAQSAQQKFDDAIKTLTDLSAQRDSALPIDGVLMQLAQTCVKASKPQDARAAYKRVVDEFPSSPYVASARQQLTQLN